MQIVRDEMRARSGAEVAFVVMRALARARLLWAHGGALPVEVLPGIVPAPAEAIAQAIDRLCEEGIAERAGPGAAVRLTERAAREICPAPLQ
jgi:hypothetical protein